MTQPRLLDRVRAEIRTRHYSYRTEQAYVLWIKKYLHFNGLQHPRKLGQAEITAWLSYLAVSRGVSASTQNQALSDILFRYRQVLKREIAWMDDIDRAPRPTRVPTLLRV
jgi:site-specific recombinase XerD